MPDYGKHTAQAEHNEKLLSTFESQSWETEFGDWYVTIAFYSAVHYFEAMLYAVKPNIPVGGVKTEFVEHSSNRAFRGFYETHSEHCVREKLIRLKFGRISAPFNWLYERSRTARYNCQALEDDDCAKAKSNLQKVKSLCRLRIEETA